MESTEAILCSTSVRMTDKVIAGFFVSVGSQGLVGSGCGFEDGQGLPCVVPRRYPAALAGQGYALPVFPISTKEGATPVFPRDNVRGCVALSLGVTDLSCRRQASLVD